MMAILLVPRFSEVIMLEAGCAEEHPHDHGFDAMPAILDGDEWGKMLLDGDWVGDGASRRPLSRVLAPAPRVVHPRAQFRCRG